MDRLRKFVELIFSNDKYIFITAFVIIITIVLIANVFGKLATAIIAFILMMMVLVLAPIMINNSYKKFRDNKKEDDK